MKLGSALRVAGASQIPERGPVLVTCNHYSRPGFQAWWVALAISAVVAAQRATDADPEIHWVMTNAWTFPTSAWRHRFLTPATRSLFRRIARVYRFIPMPPMPPDPDEVWERASAVLQTVRLAHDLAPRGGMIGLAPEGMDVPGGVAAPPRGAGRFLALLVMAGMPVLPAGVFEKHGALHLSFGPVFVPQIPHQRGDRDACVASEVMGAIRRQVAAIASM